MLLPGQDKPAPSALTSGTSSFVVSCEVTLSEVGLGEIRKPQVEQVWEPQTGGFAKDTDREPIVLFLCSSPPHSSSFQPIPTKVREFCEALPQ
jgi:hypothetical protein